MGVAEWLQLADAYMSTWLPAGRISPDAVVALDCSIITPRTGDEFLSGARRYAVA